MKLKIGVVTICEEKYFLIYEIWRISIDIRFFAYIKKSAISRFLYDIEMAQFFTNRGFLDPLNIPKTQRLQFLSTRSLISLQIY